MRVELNLASNDPSLHALRDAWLATGRRFDGDTTDLARNARAMHATLAERDIPTALRDTLALVPRLANLLTDDDWQLAPEHRRDFVGALAYFVDNDDLIPDNVGRYGYLDDVLVLQLALQSSSQEWQDWNDCRRFRDAHPQIDSVDRDDWQHHRETLIDRMVKRAARLRDGADDGSVSSYGGVSRTGAARFNVR